MSLCLYLHLFLYLSPALICLTVCGDYGIIWSRCEKLINGLSVPGATCVWLNCVSVWVAISKVSSEPSSSSPSTFTPTSLSPRSKRECIQAAAELSHSPKWSKYFGQLVVCNNCSCHRCCCCSYVVAANYDKQQLSEICAVAPAPSGSTSPVLVGALFVANCLWRQRYKQNKRRRCRHKQMQLHAPCPMFHAPCRGRVRSPGHL